jgi:hypothetical protein
MGKRGMRIEFWCKSMKKSDNQEDLSAEGRIKLKRSLEK